MTELLIFILGLLIGAGGMYFLKRDEVRRATDQHNLMAGLLSKRLGYREPVVEAPPGDPVEAEIKRIETRLQSTEDDVPDLLKRQDDARRLTELQTKKAIEVAKEIEANSSLSPKELSVS